MDKITKNWRLILFIAMSIVIVVLYKIGVDMNNKLKEEQMYNDTKAIQDSINYRKYVRQLEEEVFQYSDSLRTLKINLILSENENNREKTNDAIKRLRNSDNAYRDSIWANEWAKEESSPF
jgi:hypothetical protein